MMGTMSRVIADGLMQKYKEATKDQEKEIANKILYARGRQKEQSNAIVEMS